MRGSRKEKAHGVKRGRKRKGIKSGAAKRKKVATGGGQRRILQRAYKWAGANRAEGEQTSCR